MGKLQFSELGTGQHGEFAQQERMRFLMICCIILAGGWRLAAGPLETRLHHFEYAPPELVEKQLRALIPEGPRVSMNAEAGQVIVIADAATHEKIAAMLHELGRPPHQLQFWVRHNRDSFRFATGDGVPVSLPVSQTPPPQLVEMARARLAPETRHLPVVGSALQVNIFLLKEDPPLARMRVVPAVLFGPLQPYEVVSFDDLTMDFLVETEQYIELQAQLSQHDFYRLFMQTQPDPQAAPRPVSLLISFEGLAIPAPAGEAADED